MVTSGDLAGRAGGARALRAVSKATSPPPMTTTRSPTAGGLPRLTSRRKSTACRAPSRSSPGTGEGVAALQAGAEEDGLVAVGEQGVDGEIDAAALVEAQVDAQRADPVDLALQHACGRRWSGMPTRSMPPATGSASNTVVA